MGELVEVGAAVAPGVADGTLVGSATTRVVGVAAAGAIAVGGSGSSEQAASRVAITTSNAIQPRLKNASALCI